jgi:hypothetical protein
MFVKAAQISRKGRIKMTKFKVHTYIDVRIPFEVDAENFKQVLKEAEDNIMYTMRIINELIENTGAEVTDDINEHMVDEYDDKGEQIVQSKRFSATWEEIK